MDPEDEELPALETPQEMPDDAALLAARRNMFAAQPQQPQQPSGARVYDNTAAVLAAARKGPDALASYYQQQGYQTGDGPAQQPQMPQPQMPPQAAAAPAQPSDYQTGLAALQARIERNQAMQEQGVASAYERSRPSESEKWLGIAAALASPTQHGSFGETMGNVFQALIQHKQGVRQAETTRQSELARLRSAYDIASINAMARGLKPPTAATLAFDPLGQARNKTTGELAADNRGRPVVRTDEEFTRLPAGAEFIDIHGNIRRKPGG